MINDDLRKNETDYLIDEKTLSSLSEKKDWEEIRPLLEEKGIL